MSIQPIRKHLYAPLRVLVYSSNALVRRHVIGAIGRSPDSSIPTVDFIEAATRGSVMRHLASGQIDLVVLDGEATPAGGLGVAKELRDELLQCPPVVVLTGRAADDWLARWSCADGVVSHPADPIALTQTVVPLLRTRFVA